MAERSVARERDRVGGRTAEFAFLLTSLVDADQVVVSRNTTDSIAETNSGFAADPWLKQRLSSVGRYIFLCNDVLAKPVDLSLSLSSVAAGYLGFLPHLPFSPSSGHIWVRTPGHLSILECEPSL